VEREVLQRCDEDGEDQAEPTEEAGDPPARRRVAAKDERVAEREQRHEHDGLGVEAPRVRMHAATLVARGRSSVAEQEVSNLRVAGSIPAARSVRGSRYVFRNENSREK
jgi:hypothetical protein